MYNIIQLNDKDLSELQVIAKELGIKKNRLIKKGKTLFTKYSMNKQSPEPQRKLPQTSLKKNAKKNKRKSVHA